MRYRCDIFSNSQSAIDTIYETHYDLLLLDVKVHGQNGFEMLKELRDNGNKTPAIFITSLTSIKDLTQGYESECCDYIRKPFELIELQLRIENVIKQFYESSEDRIDLPLGFSYDLKRFKLFRDKEEIPLSKTEIKILELLIKHRDQVVTLEQFSEEVWDHSVLEANIRVQINQLRKKSDKNLIKNIRGVGYSIASE